jgi:hypothetical protein
MLSEKNLLKLVCLVFVFVIIVFVGCVNTIQQSTNTNLAPSNGINCEADVSCMRSAFNNSCQNAYYHSIYNALGDTQTVDMTISKKNGSCVFEMITRMNGQRTSLVSQSFLFPLSECPFCLPYGEPGGSCNGLPAYLPRRPGFNTTDGNCAVFVLT